MKKTTVILWIVAALFLISSLPLFAQGDVAAGACGVVIAAILFAIGIRKKRTEAKPENENASSTMQQIGVTDEAEKKADKPTQSQYEFLRIKVAGVTFKNGRKSRQTILRKIHFKDEPFDKDLEATLQREEFEGAPAFAVFINDEQIGYIPKEHVQYVQENFARCDGITHIDVYGGGDRNYGAEITLRFRKE